MKFRPRFSVRTLAIIVTLVCAYFGAWEATKRYGVPNAHPQPLESDALWGESDTRIWRADPPVPFIVQQDDIIIPAHDAEWERRIEEVASTAFRNGKPPLPFPDPPLELNAHCKRRYYLWLFGIKIIIHESISGLPATP